MNLTAGTARLPHFELWHACDDMLDAVSLRVLVVDDHVASAEALAVYLQHCGVEARAAYNGCDALAIASQWMPDAMVLDIAMPDLSGLAVCTALRRNPATSETAVLAYTAQEPGDRFAEMRRTGFDGVCIKPADPGHLLWMLSRIGRQRSQPQ